MTDPPYNVRVNGHVGGRGLTQHKEFAFASGEMSPDEYRAFLNETVARPQAHAKLEALIYIFIDWRHVEDLLSVCRKTGSGTAQHLCLEKDHSWARIILSLGA